MVERHYILATAGHVDHGKSALVLALTGIDPDRLPEEKARGITIVLGFAHLDLCVAVPEQCVYRLGLVDVPGHEDFVKNMVAGVGSVDLALLVVSADDGWMPQTEEHLQILCYMGITRAVVALTKSDLATDVPQSIAQVREQLRGSPFAAAPIVPTSVVTGRGLEELKGVLSDELSSTPTSPDIGKPRLWIDRVFTLRGVGTVVTGTLAGGDLSVGQTVVIHPAGLTARIRRLQSHKQDLPRVQPGMRVALNLADVATSDVRRGSVVILAGSGSVSRRVDVLLEKSGRVTRTSSGPERALKEGSRVRLHIGSGHVNGTVRWLDSPLSAGSRALARIELESNLFAFAGDRFVVRDWAGQRTVAGGVILDPHGQGWPWRDGGRVDRLRRRGNSPSDAGIYVACETAERGVIGDATALAQARFSAADIVAAVATLARSGEIVLAGDGWVHGPLWTGWLAQARERVRAHHRNSPEATGLALVDLQSGLRLADARLLDPLVEELTRHGFVWSGAVIREATHRPSLPPRLQAAGMRMRSVLSDKPLEPPSRVELAPDESSLAALRYLVRNGEAVEVGKDLVMSAEGYTQAVSMIQGHLRLRGRATVSELRQVLGTTRRIVVPLLEKLDRERVTRRDGDWRVLTG